MAYDVGAGVEGLVAAALVAGPVGQLDGAVGAGRDGVGQVLELVALVAGLDGGDVADDLLAEVVLGGGVCGLSVLWRNGGVRLGYCCRKRC